MGASQTLEKECAQLAAGLKGDGLVCWMRIKLDFTGTQAREPIFVRLIIRKEDGGQPYIYKVIFDGYQHKLDLIFKLRTLLLALNEELEGGVDPNDKFDLLVQLQVLGPAKCTVKSAFSNSVVRFYQKTPAKSSTDDLFLELLRMIVSSL
jgi:hypothetical protein